MNQDTYDIWIVVGWILAGLWTGAMYAIAVNSGEALHHLAAGVLVGPALGIMIGKTQDWWIFNKIRGT